MAIIIKTSGRLIEMPESAYDENGEVTLASLQEAVGGYIELIYLRKPVTLHYPDTGENVIYTMLVVNEDGISENLEQNNTASMAVATTLPGTAIVGNAVLLKPGEIS